jgi:hypothetical protein
VVVRSGVPEDGPDVLSPVAPLDPGVAVESPWEVGVIPVEAVLAEVVLLDEVPEGVEGEAGPHAIGVARSIASTNLRDAIKPAYVWITGLTIGNLVHRS